MKAIHSFILACEGGFVRQDQLSRVIELDRLAQMLVRCGCCRFVAPAQDVPTLTRYVTAGGDYVRDVSFTASLMAEAAAARIEDGRRAREAKEAQELALRTGCGPQF